MLRATGFSDADFARPQIGVASTWANVTPCNITSESWRAKRVPGSTAPAARACSSTPSPCPTAFRWARGHAYSLVSREIIADSIEAVAGAAGFDGLIAARPLRQNMPVAPWRSRA